jgi:GGDEF domain-containing protein
VLRAASASDIAARWGGKFVVLMPSSSHAARGRAERLRSAIAAHAFEAGHVTVSAGVAVASGRSAL